MDILNFKDKWLPMLDDQFSQEEYFTISANIATKVQLWHGYSSSTGSTAGDTTFQYKIGGGQWQEGQLKAGPEEIYIDLPANTKMYFYRQQETFSTNEANFDYHIMVSGNFTSRDGWIAFGDITSLINYAAVTPYCFKEFFSVSNCKQYLRDVSGLKLPGGTLQVSCFEGLFKDCSGMVKAPSALPAATMANACYKNMFHYCSGITTAPELPATTLAPECYYSMFSYCTSLTGYDYTLPATDMPASCYYGMFWNCNSMTILPVINGTTTSKDCCNQMFSFCANGTWPNNYQLTLKPTTLAEGCYQDMFSSCRSIIIPPIICGTVVNDRCCQYMFSNCAGLSSVPKLVAKDLALSCYYGMFQGCTSIKQISASNILASGLASSCCLAMFSGCTALSSVSDNLGFNNSTFSYTSAFAYMFKGCTKLSTFPTNFFSKITEYGNYGCESMFQGCTKLRNTPFMTNYITQSGCFKNMFRNCTSLTATTKLMSYDFDDLAKSCYEGMFYNCSSLTSLTAQLLGWSKNKQGETQYFTTNWVQNILTNPGIFYYNGAFQDDITLRDKDHVPVYWNVQDFTATPNKGLDARTKYGGLVNVIVPDTGLKVVVLPEKPDRIYGNWSIIIGVGGKKKRVRKFYEGGTTEIGGYYIEDDQTGVLEQTITKGSDGKFKATFNGEVYEIISQFDEPFCLSAVDGVSRYWVHIDNPDPNYHWFITTEDPDNPGKMASISFKNRGNICVDVSGHVPTFIYNYGTNLNTSSRRTHIWTSKESVGTTGVPVLISGQLNSLTGATSSTKALKQYEFYGVFSGWTDLKYIANTVKLPYDIAVGSIPSYCFAYMFYNCPNLTGHINFAPELEDTLSCGGGHEFQSMFQGCTSLSSVSKIWAMATNSYSYSNMFQGCTSLTNISFEQLKGPDSSTSRQYTFQRMFKDSHLTNINGGIYLHSDIGTACYKEMFAGTLITNAPNVDMDDGSIQFNDYCFAGMFSGCGNLTTETVIRQVPNAREYRAGCCSAMYYGCDDLNLGTATLHTEQQYIDPSWGGIGYPDYPAMGGSGSDWGSHHQITATANGWFRVSVKNNGYHNGGIIAKFGNDGSASGLVLYGFRGANCGNTWLLPAPVGTTLYLSSFINETSNDDSYHHCVKFAASLPGSVGYPDYTLLSLDGNGTAVPSGQNFEVEYDGWIRISVLNQNGIKDGCVRFYQGDTQVYLPCHAVINNGPSVSYLLPVRRGYSYRWTSATSASLAKYAPCRGGVGIGFPDYQALANGGTSIPQGNNFYVREKGWVRFTAISGSCLRFSLNGAEWDYAMPLYGTNLSNNSTVQNPPTITFMLPVAAGDDIKWIKGGGNAMAEVVYAPDLATNYYIDGQPGGEGGGSSGGDTITVVTGPGDWDSVLHLYNSTGNFYSNCCDKMFANCISITYGAVWPSEVYYQGTNEFYRMYNNCSNLRALKWNCPSISICADSGSHADELGMGTPAGGYSYYFTHNIDDSDSWNNSVIADWNIIYF